MASSRSTPRTCSWVRASLSLSVLSSASSISLRSSSLRSDSLLSFSLRFSIIFSFIAEWFRSISRRSFNSNTWFCSFSKNDLSSSKTSPCFNISFSSSFIRTSFSDFSAADWSAVFRISCSACTRISSSFVLLSWRLSSISFITRSCKSKFLSFSSASSFSSLWIVPSVSRISTCTVVILFSFSLTSSSSCWIWSWSLCFAISSCWRLITKWSIFTSLFATAAFSSSLSTSHGPRFTFSSSKLSLISLMTTENSMFFLNTSSSFDCNSSILWASSENIVSKSSSKCDNCLLNSCSGMSRTSLVGLSGLPLAESPSSSGPSSPLNSWYLFLISPSSRFMSSTRLSYSADFPNRSSIFFSCFFVLSVWVRNSARMLLLVSSTALMLALSSLMKELWEASRSLILLTETSEEPMRWDSWEPGDMQCKCRLILSTFPLMSLTVFWYSSTLRFRSFVASFFSFDWPFSDDSSSSMVKARSLSFSTCISRSLISFWPSSTFFAISSECSSCCLALSFIACSCAESSSFLARSLLLAWFNVLMRLSRSFTCLCSALSLPRRSSKISSTLESSLRRFSCFWRLYSSFLA